MKKLLVLKHWQLFIVLFVLPFFIQFAATFAVLASETPTMLFIVFPIIIVLFMGTFFSWLYTLGTNLHKKLPQAASMKLLYFKMALIFPVLYILVMAVLMYYMFSSMVVNEPPNFAWMLLIIPFHFFSMFCILFVLYFIAKALKSVEQMKEARFNDFIGEFFLIWFFPIGVWFIQPRVNKLFDDNLPLDTDQALDSNLS